MRLVMAATLIVTSSAASAQISPHGGEFQVNSYTTGTQAGPAVAAGPQGGFVVTWASYGGLASIRAQRFSGQAVPLGGEFQVNSYYTGALRLLPQVNLDSAGNFVIVWEDVGSGEVEVRAQRYDAEGTALGAEFLVSSYPSGIPGYGGWYIGPPSVASEPGGSFVVAWGSAGSVGSDFSGYSIQARRFDADGIPLGDQFQVNSYTTSHQENAAAAVSSTGDFVIVWDSWGSSGPDPGLSIQAQRYDANGGPVGAEFQVNAYTPGSQFEPTVVFDSSSSFVVAWMSQGSTGSDTSSWSIQARRFSADGTPLGGQFQVNSYTTGMQTKPVVAADTAGDFVVGWTSRGSYGTDESLYSVQAQRFRAGGTALDEEFQVNTYTTGDQWMGSVASDSSGNLVVTWSSSGSGGSDTSSSSIQAQRYDALFRDGVEAGDTSRWSATIP